MWKIIRDFPIVVFVVIAVADMMSLIVWKSGENQRRCHINVTQNCHLNAKSCAMTEQEIWKRLIFE